MAKASVHTFADFLESEREALLGSLLRAQEMLDGRHAGQTLREWIQNEIDYLRGGADRSNEWVASLLQTLQRDGGGQVECLRYLLSLRDALLRHGARRGVGLESEWLYDQVLRLTDRYMQHLAEHCAQEHRAFGASFRRRQRQIIETLESPFVLLDNDGVIQLANGAFSELSGVPEAAGRELVSFCDGATGNELRRSLRQRKATAPRAFAGYLISGKGAMSPAAFYAQPLFSESGLRDGIAVGINVQESLNAESAYLAKTLEETLKFIPLALQVIDRAGVIAFRSGTCCGNIDEPLLANEPLCCRLLAREEGVCPHERVLSDGQLLEREAPYSRAEGLRWLRIVLVPIRDNSGRVTHASLLALDVTQRRGLEHQILEHQRSSAVTQVALAVAHQLRNPLGVMVGFAELLSKGLPPQQVPHAVEKILSSGMRCKQIVEELLEFGEAAPGDRVPTPLAKLVQERVQPMFTSAQKRRIRFDIADARLSIECVPNQMAQVFVSLLDNALEAGRKVVFSAASEGDAVVVRVADDGPGVPEAFRERIFEPFFTTRKEAGAVGLGLSLSRSVVVGFGGHLTLEKSETGAVFAITMPNAENAAGADTEPSAPGPRAEKRILIVDDELDLLAMLETALSLEQFIVDTATTAADGERLLDQHCYDAAVLDVQLPGEISGPQLFARLCTRQPQLARHVFFITADKMNFETRQFLEQTQRPVLEKPFLVTAFMEKLREVLAARTAR